MVSTDHVPAGRQLTRGNFSASQSVVKRSRGFAAYPSTQ
jgi:hypothetical protein